MRSETLVCLSLVVALGACGDSATAPAAAGGAAPLLAAGSGGIAGEYIVVLKEGASPTAVAAVAGVHPRHVYSEALNGFAAPLNRGQLAALRHHPAVEYVEQDQEARLAAAPLPSASVPWGLDRINQQFLPLDGNAGFFWPSAANVTAYIIDTGIRTTHSQFGTRAQNVFSSVGGSFACPTYGTFMAGVVGGSTFGVVNGIRLRGVEVVNCTGSGTMSGVIAGVDWVRSNAQRPAVATLSVGGGYSSALNSAVNGLAAAGVFVAVGSGDSNANACSFSPGSASGAAVVNASRIDDHRAPFSNFGSCTHLYAPGVNIPTASSASNTATTTVSGTAIAAAHVAGVGAQLLAGSPSAASGTVRNWIVTTATPNVIIGNPLGTPNLLLFR